MLIGADDVLHGFTHTVLGALIIAWLVTLVTPMVRRPLLKRWNQEVRHYNKLWLQMPEALPSRSIATGALFGALSHVALDSLIHQDMQPLFPLSLDNPMLGLISHDAVYMLCAVATVAGAIAWGLARWREGDQAIAPSAAHNEGSTVLSIWSVWVRDLRVIWIAALFFAAVPAFLYGAAIFAIGVLALSVFVGSLRLILAVLIGDRNLDKGLRASFVAALMSAVALVYVFAVDATIPRNADPIVKAIQAYHDIEGEYPVDLQALSPRYLTEMPALRRTVFQPPITYRIADGKPYLRIPSANGDMFAMYEYDFVKRTWIHRS